MALKIKDIRGLSDLDLAIFTYAIETFADVVYEDGFKARFCNRTQSICRVLNSEYRRRNIDCDIYYKREQL